MARIIFLFFFLSGFSSLVFEIVWERALMRVFGNTSFALATLLTAFMSGLALGSYLGGRYAKKIPSPLITYGLLEACIGLYALFVPALLGLLPAVYSLVFEHFVESFYLFNLFRFALVFLLLLVPTTMMGATLPIISHWISERENHFQPRIGWLYAANTAGATAGTMLAGFVLLPALGLIRTNQVFFLVNLLLCVLVLVSVRWIGAARVGPRDDDVGELEQALGRRVMLAPASKLVRRLVLGLFAATGFVAMAYQILWTRAYVIVIGSSTYSFTIILSTYLLALAIGSGIGGALVSRIQRPIYWFALTQWFMVLSAMLTFVVLEAMPEYLFIRVREGLTNPAELFVFQYGLTALLVFVPIALQGLAFVLVIRALLTRREASGEEVGRYYAINTVGAIVGGFVAGFVLMPALGLQSALSIVVFLHLVTAAGLTVTHLLHEDRAERFGRRALVALLTGLLVVGAFFLRPSIDTINLTRGMFRVYWAREVYNPDSFRRDRPELLYEAHGFAATTTVERRGNLVTLKANGKPEASDGADMSTQILVSLLPFLVRSAQGHAVGGEKVAMIGWGSGVTAGAALQWPLGELHVVEIERTMLEASRFFEHVNHRPLEDPRTHFIEGDGRNWLEYSPRTWDVVISEPSNPWISGIASMFTQEHFANVERKLRPGGVFAQWVQLYEISPENVRRVITTLRSVFPYVVGFSSMPKSTDLILIASRQPLVFPPQGFESGFENERIARELRRAGIHSSWDLYGLVFMTQTELEEFSKDADINTDDNGLLEFSAPLDLIRYDIGQEYFARHYFRNDLYGDIRPFLQDWASGWTPEQKANLARAFWMAGKEGLARMVAFPEQSDIFAVLQVRNLDLFEVAATYWPPSQSSWREVFVQAHREQGLRQVRQYLMSQPDIASDGLPGERGLLLALILAQQGYYRDVERQLRLLKRQDDPVTRSLVFAILEAQTHYHRRRYRESFESYVKAFHMLEAELVSGYDVVEAFETIP